MSHQEHFFSRVYACCFHFTKIPYNALTDNNFHFRHTELQITAYQIQSEIPVALCFQHWKLHEYVNIKFSTSQAVTRIYFIKPLKSDSIFLHCE